MNDSDDGRDIFIMRADGANPTNLTNHPALDERPSWSPDGTQLAFVSTRDGAADLYIMSSDGSDVRRLTSGTWVYHTPSWAPDGRHIAFSAESDDENLDILIISLGTLETINVTAHPASDISPAWSPDGTKIAFVSDRDELVTNLEIYVMNVGDGNVERLTNNPGPDYYPVWSPDGTEIAYQCGDGVICIMNSDGSGSRQFVFDGYYPSWSPDGLWIAFASTREGAHGKSAIYVASVDGLNTIRLTELSLDVSRSQAAWQP